MNQRIKLNSRALLNYVRFARYRVRNSISISGRQFLSVGSKLDINMDAFASIAPYMWTENGTNVAVRPGGNLKIGKGVFLNRNCILVCRDRIEIGDHVTVGPNCCIYDHDHDLNTRGKYTTAPVYIGEGSWIGAGSIILKGVTIGKNCVIAAGGVITKDVPDDTIVYQKRENTYVNKFLK